MTADTETAADPATATVLLVDAHDSKVMDVLAGLIDGEPGLVCAGTSRSFPQTAEGFAEGRLRPDVLVVDPALHGSDDAGHDLIRSALAARPGMRVVVYSIRPGAGPVGAARDAGASAFVSKSVRAAQLLDVIAMVATPGSVSFVNHQG